VVPLLEINVNVGPEIVISDNEQLKLIHFKKKYAEFSSSLKAVGSSEYQKAFIDELNSVYVALTRAIDELYVFIPTRSQRGPNSAALLFPQGAKSYGKKTDSRVTSVKKELQALEIPPSEYKDWISLLKDEFIHESLLRSRENVARGEMMHCVLSFIGNLRGQDKVSATHAALEKAKRKFPAIADFPGIEPAILALLAQEKLRYCFEVFDGEVFTEQEVIDASGNTKRIDRLIVASKEAIVIDYKSARDTACDYRAQMAEYVSIVSDIYPLHKVKGILLYLDDLSTEEVA